MPVAGCAAVLTSRGLSPRGAARRSNIDSRVAPDDRLATIDCRLSTIDYRLPPMHHILVWAEAVARAAGGPGLFLIAFLDASVLSLPEINDLLVVWMVTQHKARLFYYVSMATLGSVAGCFVVYYLGRVGADAFLRRRFGEAQMARAHRFVERWGFLAILIPAILPPPAPFKVFVLLAGIAAMPVRVFAAAVALGRGARYAGEGLLAVRYGDRAGVYLRDHGAQAALIGAGVAAAVAVLYAWSQRRAGRAER
jgi:membrane protein YqaA with SNARE-associated domain